MIKKVCIVTLTLLFITFSCFFIINILPLFKYNNLSDEEYIVELNNAIVNNDDKKFYALLKQNRDISRCKADYYDGESPCEWTLTPLQLACDVGDYDYVKLLIKNDADVNGPNYNCYQSPLLYAIKSSNEKEKYDIIKLLLEEGADIKAKDKHGKTALYYAESKNIIELLEKNK